jgi:hypothetical protein
MQWRCRAARYMQRESSCLKPLPSAFAALNFLPQPIKVLFAIGSTTRTLEWVCSCHTAVCRRLHTKHADSRPANIILRRYAVTAKPGDKKRLDSSFAIQCHRNRRSRMGSVPAMDPFLCFSVRTHGWHKKCHRNVSRYVLCDKKSYGK